MAYIYWGDIRLHSVFLSVTLLLLPQILWAQSASANEKMRIDVAGTKIDVPVAHPFFDDRSFVLNCDEAQLLASMQAHRMHEQSDEEQPLFRRNFVFDDDKLAHQVRGLRIVPLEGRLGEAPLWWVEPEGAANTTQDGAVCEHAADEPWTIFSLGLSHVDWGRIVSEAHGGQKKKQGLVRIVTLRHAAALLPHAWRGSVSHEGCAAQGEGEPETLDAAAVADRVVWHSASRGKRLALTFDACSTYSYGPFNQDVIAALKTLDVPSTLFVGGHWAELHGDVLQTLAQDPLFEIGNHTYSHPHMRDLTPAQQAQELRWTQALIYNKTGVVPRMFRPPYGEVDDAMLHEVAKAGLTTVEYDLPAGDADVHVSALKLTHWVVGQAHPGSIVIMHMNRPKNHTAEALPHIVGALRAQGFTFCKMSDLLSGEDAPCR